jgi:hypothetical protein
VTAAPPTQPTLASLARVLPPYGRFRLDSTLAAAREAVGDHPDLADAQHAAELLTWLNKWLCRIRTPQPGDAENVFADSLADFWADFETKLPLVTVRLSQMSDAQLQVLGDAYANLRVRRAAVNRNGKSRSIGPTAAAKLLYFVRPEGVTAWDKAISKRTGGGRSGGAFLRHLTLCREWARSLEREGRQLGLESEEIGPHLGRPTSSVAKLLDEWLYGTITGGFGKSLVLTWATFAPSTTGAEARSQAGDGRPAASL